MTTGREPKRRPFAMARRGVSLFLISKILGNTIAVVERTYAKYSPGDLQKAVDLITNGEL